MPLLPNELSREIMGHLYRPDNRSTLLSLALVSDTWRHESQRLLFRSPGPDWFSTRVVQDDEQRQAHIHFLECVLTQPTRLGGYVHSYEQTWLAVDPTLVLPGETYTYHHYIYATHLWNLTCRTLPFFVNLKRLAFTPCSLKGSAAAVVSLCRPQLTSLTINGHFIKDEEWGFFRKQDGLLHIQTSAALQNFPRDMWPVLKSATYWSARDVDLFLQLMVGRKSVAALELYHISASAVSACQSETTGFGHVKYVHLPLYNGKFMRAFRNIVLLVLNSWSVEVIESLRDLDQIRTLALQHRRHSANITQDEEKRAIVAQKSKKRCPKIIHILHILSARRGHYHFTKITLSLPYFSSTGQKVFDIHTEDVSEYNPDALWWQIYGI